MLKQITIKYIYHSSFLVKIDNKVLIFDYFEGELPNLNPAKDEIFFFATHSHPDHYSTDIFEFENSYTFKYYLSSDIKPQKANSNVVYLGEQKEITKLKKLYNKNVTFLKENTYLEKDNLSIKTFSSTDKGIALLIEIDGINIFHAGDLNLWIWDEDTDEEKKAMNEAFKKEIDKIKKSYIDLAFFPLDPRLNERYADGFNIFIKEVNPSIIFPMHFRDNISKVLSYMSQFPENKKCFRPIFKRNQNFIINYEV